MIHLGDITKISGYNVLLVDAVIGGRPWEMEQVTLLGTERKYPEEKK